MAATDLPHTLVLGIPFFTGSASEAVDRMLSGGLLVVPSAPTLKEIQTQPAYRAALLKFAPRGRQYGSWPVKIPPA